MRLLSFQLTRRQAARGEGPRGSPRAISSRTVFWSGPEATAGIVPGSLDSHRPSSLGDRRSCGFGLIGRARGSSRRPREAGAGVATRRELTDGENLVLDASMAHGRPAQPRSSSARTCPLPGRIGRRRVHRRRTVSLDARDTRERSPPPRGAISSARTQRCFPRSGSGPVALDTVRRNAFAGTTGGVRERNRAHLRLRAGPLGRWITRSCRQDRAYLAAACRARRSGRCPVRARAASSSGPRAGRDGPAVPRR
jgi:hypothetical protein